MTDVPGHTRGGIAPAGYGVRPARHRRQWRQHRARVPPLFLGKIRDGASLIMGMYHRHQYGGMKLQVPGSDMYVDIEVTATTRPAHHVGDPQGLPRLREQFPNATITAGSMTDVANAVAPYRDKLPVLNDEIGDTWIYGVPSDPVKVAKYLELARLRASWSQERVEMRRDRQCLLRNLLLAVERTWNANTKTWLDFNLSHSARSVADALTRPAHKVVTLAGISGRTWPRGRQSAFGSAHWA